MITGLIAHTIFDGFDAAYLASTLTVEELEKEIYEADKKVDMSCQLGGDATGYWASFRMVCSQALCLKREITARGDYSDYV